MHPPMWAPTLPLLSIPCASASCLGGRHCLCPLGRLSPASSIAATVGSLGAPSDEAAPQPPIDRALLRAEEAVQQGRVADSWRRRWLSWWRARRPARRAHFACTRGLRRRRGATSPLKEKRTNRCNHTTEMCVVVRVLLRSRNNVSRKTLAGVPKGPLGPT